MPDTDGFSPAGKHEKKKMVIGIGGFGIKVVRQLMAEPTDFVHRVLLDRADTFTDIDPADMSRFRILMLPPAPSGRPRGDMVAVARDVKRIIPEIEQVLSESSFVLMIAGMGGGVGSGAAPVVARLLEQFRIPSLAVVVMPSERKEGRKRCMTADLAVRELKNFVKGTFILNTVSTSWGSGHGGAGDLMEELESKIRVLTDVLFDPGIVSVDMSSINNVISQESSSTIIVKEAEGKSRGLKAALAALEDPAIKPYRNHPASIVVHIRGGANLSLYDLDEAATFISENWGGDIDLVYGASIDPELGNRLRLGIIVGAGMRSRQRFRVISNPNQENSEPGVPGDSTVQVAIVHN